MRIIKFRAWDKENETMIYPKGILFNGRVVFFSCGVLEPFEGYELMQYTGLKDVAGTEIYEGDIVIIHDSFETKIGYKSEVLFTVDGARVWTHPIHRALDVVSPTRLLSHYCDYGHGGKPGRFCKIIGNIYENPELLA